MRHDFRRDGARTVAIWHLGRVAAWIEESAAYHAFDTATYGVALTRRRDMVDLRISLGRWSLNVAL